MGTGTPGKNFFTEIKDPGGNHCKKAIRQFSSYVTEGKDGHRVL